MDLLQSIILGLIQGFTEWLPISSTGHLRLAEIFMNLQVPVVFDGLLHVGTLVVTLVFFRKDIISVLSSLWKRDFSSDNGRIVPLVIAGTIPAVLIGLLLGDTIDALFQGLTPLAGAFAFCGIALYASRMGKDVRTAPTLVEALVIGIAQGIAIIPGVSRSGLTIAIALMLGVKREKAFTFSFLLSIPAIAGAVGLTFITGYAALVTSDISLVEVLLGVLFSMAVGYFALGLLRKVLLNKKLHLFALYCWGIAIILLGLGLWGF